MPYFLIIFLLSSTLLFGELDLGFEPQPVTIKGEGLSAQEVLEQVESQLDIQIELKSPDKYGFKKDYNDLVDVNYVFKAVIAYYREYNHVELEMVKRARRKIILREVVETMPETSDAAGKALKKVDREMEVGAPEDLVALESPPISTPAPSSMTRRELHRSENDLGKMAFEVTDLISLTDTAPVEKKVDEAPLNESRKALPQNPGSLTDFEEPVPKATVPSLQIELVGAKAGLVDFDEPDVAGESKEDVAESSGKLSERWGEEEKAKENFFANMKQRTSDEWQPIPEVEMGYFGSTTPFFKPGLLAYQVPAADTDGELRFGLGHSVHEHSSVGFNAVDLKTQKLSLHYQSGLSDSLLINARTAVVKHDGDILVNSVRHDVDDSSLSDVVIGLNYLPQDVLDYGSLSLGLEVAIPLGGESGYAGAGGLGLNVSAGYHVSFGLWRGASQVNFTRYGDVSYQGLDEKSGVFSADFQLGYYIGENYDLAFQAHLSESPWEGQSGVWDVDIFQIKTVLQTHAWTYPLSFYVDLGLSDATPDYGLGVQLFKELL